MIIQEILLKLLYSKIKITPTKFGQMFKIAPERAMEYLDEGVSREIFIQSLFLESNKLDSEYQVSEMIEAELAQRIVRDDLKEFDDFGNKYFGEIDIREVVLSPELQKIQQKCLMYISLRQRTTATELLVKEIESNTFIHTTKDDQKSEMWIYIDGIYEPQGESFVKEFCRRILGYAFTSQIANEVIAKIQADTFIGQEEFFRNENQTELPILDGLLNIITKEISPFSPKKIYFNKLPIHYNPDAICPRIDSHFKTILRNEEDAKVMYEIFGYCLLKENSLEKAFMFSGFGRNGKGKTLSLLKAFLGIKNCCALPLKLMHEESFSLHELFGKMCNIAGDLSSGDLKSTGVLKNLIGRDTIQAKRKFLRDLNFVNFAKLVFACNELPKVFDLTEGFWTKWLLLEFPYKFITQKEYNSLEEKDKKDKKIINPDIIKELTTEEELSGLLNIALDSLIVVLENKEFSSSKGTEEIKSIWIRISNSFTAFCHEHLEEDYNSKISKKDLRKVYRNYCKRHKLKGAGDKEIKSTLQDVFGADEMQEKESGNRFWDGVKFKEIKEKFEVGKL